MQYLQSETLALRGCRLSRAFYATAALLRLTRFPRLRGIFGTSARTDVSSFPLAPHFSLCFSFSLSLSFSKSSFLSIFLSFWIQRSITDAILIVILIRASEQRATATVSRLFVSFNRILVSRYAPGRCISSAAVLSSSSFSSRFVIAAPHPRNLYFSVIIGKVLYLAGSLSMKIYFRARSMSLLPPLPPPFLPSVLFSSAFFFFSHSLAHPVSLSPLCSSRHRLFPRNFCVLYNESRATVSH